MMTAMSPNLPKELLDKCALVTSKRPKTVIDHILKHGHITTEELKNTYGYDHPPRAVRDVKEHGIPIERFTVKGSNGRSIAAYRFGDITKQQYSKRSGRSATSSKIKKSLIEKYGPRCFIYCEQMNETSLQVDHRIPFEIDGNDDFNDFEKYMLLSPSANRLKSWSCEHCNNWTQGKDKNICFTCYWAYPEQYSHVATFPIRRLDIIWQNDEIYIYDALQKEAASRGKELPEFAKEILKSLAKNDNRHS